jgi:hypothetical protein
MDIEHRATLRYFAETAGTVLLLFGIKAAVTGLHLAPRSFNVLALAPLVPIWLMLLVTIRYYRRIDELQRLRFLQVAALTLGILLCVDWSYTCVQTVFALPPQPQDPSWLFAIIYVIVTLIVNLRGHHARPA